MDRTDPAFLSCPGSFLGKNKIEGWVGSICVQIAENMELLSPIVLLVEHWGESGTMCGNAIEKCKEILSR